MSKSVMVQKISNLRKIFNKKFKKIDDLSNERFSRNKSQKVSNNQIEMISIIKNQNSLNNVSLSAITI